MHGAMYVERLTPLRVTQPLPILFIHGHAMTGTNFLNTPDGRPGWADFFLSKGYEVYLTDQPVRGRSAFQAGVDGNQSTYTVATIESHFTATQRFNLWPQSTLHTQWPGNGSMGDPIFDSLYSSTVPSLVDELETATRMEIAGSALLDKIGPVILLTHSQSGPLGWILGNARPNLVKAIAALEPMGPPFVDVHFPPINPPHAARPFALTETPLVYDPPLSSPQDLQRAVQSNSSFFVCWEQATPARKLVNLMKIPILVVTSEASYHAIYDGCTVNYLKQAGVGVEHVNLGEVGIHGNAHLMFMEKNSNTIVELIEKWIRKGRKAS